MVLLQPHILMLMVEEEMVVGVAIRDMEVLVVEELNLV